MLKELIHRHVTTNTFCNGLGINISTRSGSSSSNENITCIHSRTTRSS